MKKYTHILWTIKEKLATKKSHPIEVRLNDYSSSLEEVEVFESVASSVNLTVVVFNLPS